MALVEEDAAQACEDISIELAGGRWFASGAPTHPVSAALADAFAPATCCLYEWVEYFAQYEDADSLRVGGEQIGPIAPGLFRVRFENHLGLAAIQPFRGGTPLCPPEWVEIISPKLGTPEAHLRFLRALLDDLFRHAARIPFTFRAQTGRGVVETMRPPTPLFVLYFLHEYVDDLHRALDVVLGAPHRQLLDRSDFVRLADATEADADVLIGILQSPDEWARATGFPLAERLGGHAPARVWQRLPEETFDTPENRFVRAFLWEVLTAAGTLTTCRWWSNVLPEHRDAIHRMAERLRHVLTRSVFGDIGPMYYLPSSSQVLLRRDGYRDLLRLWRVFHQARRPLFERLRRAMELRDVATLYEVWAFFALATEIGEVLSETPAAELHTSDVRGLDWGARVRFGERGTLVYNEYERSYSVPLRPDFTWMVQGKADVVLDAKFRLDRQTLEGGDDTPEATAKRADLYKMHTYRDALGVRAAVGIYPGDTSIFHHTNGKRSWDFTLRDLMTGDYTGVGALAMRAGD